MQGRDLEYLQKLLAEHRRQLTDMMLKTENLEVAVLTAIDGRLESEARKLKKPPLNNNGAQSALNAAIGD